MVLFVSAELFAQCGCSNAPMFVPPMQWLGPADNGLIPKKNLRLALFYRFATSSTLFEGSRQIRNAVDYQNSFIQAIASYGLSHYTTLDFDLSYSYRRLNQYGFESNGWGFSNLTLGLRQNIFESEFSDFTINIGFGTRFPLMKFKEIENYPIVIQPSTGSVGIFALFFSQLSLRNLGINIALFSRSDYNFENSQNYQFAPSVQASFIGSKELFQNFVFIAELKGDFRFRDRYNDTLYPNSGSSTLFFNSQINYKFKDIGVAFFGEIPIYQYFSGEQIGNGFAFGVYFHWLVNFNKKRL